MIETQDDDRRRTPITNHTSGPGSAVGELRVFVCMTTFRGKDL